MTKAEIQAVRLLADKRERDARGLFVAEGAKLVGELRASPMRIRHLYAVAANPQFPEAEIVPAKDMERMSMLKTASDVLAVVEKPQVRLDTAALADSLTLVLDGVQNPGNLGTIIRLADWWGIRNVVCSQDCADCFNPKVVQATMGAIIRVAVHYTDIVGVLSDARTGGIPVYGTFLDGEDIYTSALSRNGIIVMGNEGRGISDACAALVSQRSSYRPTLPTAAARSRST